MSYENTKCPCEGTKPTDTMLCDECLRAFKHRSEMMVFNDPQFSLGYRRNAAIILINLSGRRRKIA